MSSSATKKMMAEKARVMAARLEMEVKVDELNEALERIQKDIEIQRTKEIELEEKIKSSENGGTEK